jgi:hypothetical protein
MHCGEQNYNNVDSEWTCYPRTASFTPKLAMLPSVRPAIKQKTPMVPATSFSSSSSLWFRAGVEETIILNEAMYLNISTTSYHLGDLPIRDSKEREDNQIDDIRVEIRRSWRGREVTA